MNHPDVLVDDDYTAMRQVLAALELVSHGRTMRVDGRVAGSNDQSPILHADEEPYPHEEFRSRWNAAATAAERAEILDDARTALERLRKAPPPPEHLIDPDSYHFRVFIANDPRPDAELARLYPVSRKAIRSWRKKYRVGDEPGSD